MREYVNAIRAIWRAWKFGEKLKALGFEIVNDGISGAVHRDRTLITGDSPLAGNNLGKLAAETMLKEVAR
jgi:molecular chaperone Hsp31 and glyoxalase 3